MCKFAFGVVIKSFLSLARHAEINFFFGRQSDYDDGREGT